MRKAVGTVFGSLNWAIWINLHQEMVVGMSLPRKQLKLPDNPFLIQTAPKRGCRGSCAVERLYVSSERTSETVITTAHKIIDLSLTVRIQFTTSVF